MFGRSDILFYRPDDYACVGVFNLGYMVSPFPWADSTGDIGTKTCGGYPGMQGNFVLDAQTYADWGVDYLKVDGCYAEPSEYAKTYPLLGKALNETGRPIVYSCSWPAYLPDPVQTQFQVPYQALREHCNLWRNWVDIQDSWASLKSILVFWAEATLKSKGFRQVAGPGSWNDPDMLIIGNQGLDVEQSKVQMGMWAIFSAPLLMSNDLRSLAPWAKHILQSSAAIAINQDPLGQQGELLDCIGGCEKVQLWQKLLHRGDRAVAFLNIDDDAFREEICIDLPYKDQVRCAEVFDSSEDFKGNQCAHLCIQGLAATSIRLFRVSQIADAAFAQQQPVSRSRNETSSVSVS